MRLLAFEKLPILARKLRIILVVSDFPDPANNEKNNNELNPQALKFFVKTRKYIVVLFS